MQLSEHFSLGEATYSATAINEQIDNTPTPEILKEMTKAASGMEVVRALLAHPIHINSWYRSPSLNRAVGGARNSSHMDGWAIDFTCSDFGTPEDVVKFIVRKDLPFDQLIQEGNWIHISFAPELRKQVMTAHFVAGQHTTYTVGA
jgi:hypothetical protein